MDGAELMRQLEALIQFDNVSRQSMGGGRVTYQMNQPPINYHRHAREWNESIPTNTQQRQPFLVNMNDLLPMGNNEFETTDTKFGVMSQPMIPQSQLDSTTYNTPPHTPSDTKPASVQPQSDYSQHRYMDTSIDSFFMDDASTMNSFGQIRTTLVRPHSPVFDPSLDSYHDDCGTEDYDASSLLIPKTEYHTSYAVDSEQLQPQFLEHQSNPYFDPYPQLLLFPSDYTALDAIFDFSQANPLPLKQEPPMKFDEPIKSELPKFDALFSLPLPVVSPAKTEESPRVFSKWDRYNKTGRKQYVMFRNANEEERMMRDYLADEKMYDKCPFECTKRFVSFSCRRSHLRKVHYDIYYKYCRSNKTAEEEVKALRLGPPTADRLCLICEFSVYGQKDMMKHLEENHRSAFESLEKELESAKQRDLRRLKE